MPGPFCSVLTSREVPPSMFVTVDPTSLTARTTDDPTSFTERTTDDPTALERCGVETLWTDAEKR